MFPQIVIVSDAAEAPAARELVRQTGVNAAVIEAAEEEAAARVIEVFAGNAGVAVARGRLAAALKNRADIPVIEATLSVQDMAELLEKACAQVQKERPRIAFVGQRYMFSSPETIARILRAEVTILYYTRDEELPALLDQAKAEETDCVIGSPLVCAQAGRAGLSSVPIGAARDSLLSALRTAGRLADALRREQRRRQEIQYLIRYSSDAIISLGADHTIRSVNPSAEKALGHSAQELIGQNLLTLEGLGSAAALRKALDNSQPTYGIALQFARASFVANITPMIYEETREGSLVTMQEFAVIDDLDERVRQERRRRGYIAQARFAEFPSKSPAIQPVLREAEAYAPFDVPILITGEPRLPKSRLAECIHNASMRRRNPYVSVDLGTIPPENQFGLLFGQRGGGDIGLVGQAHKGTLFLLDVNLLSPDCQRQLLSILRYGNFRRKDSLEPIPVSVRVICSTFADLLDLARQDRFMWQLALTLHGISLPMPPIRETPEDIPAYLHEYMDQSAQRFKKRVTLTDEAVVHLCRYPWKNNLRDIEYFAARATILAPGPVIGLDFVREQLLPDMEDAQREQQPHIVADEEELALRRALRESDGSRAGAAESLNISRATLWRKMKKYGLE